MRKSYKKKDAISVYYAQCKATNEKPRVSEEILKHKSGNEVYKIAESHFNSLSSFKKTMWLSRIGIIPKPTKWQTVKYRIRQVFKGLK